MGPNPLFSRLLDITGLRHLKNRLQSRNLLVPVVVSSLILIPLLVFWDGWKDYRNLKDSLSQQKQDSPVLRIYGDLTLLSQGQQYNLPTLLETLHRLGLVVTTVPGSGQIKQKTSISFFYGQTDQTPEAYYFDHPLLEHKEGVYILQSQTSSATAEAYQKVDLELDSGTLNLIQVTPPGQSPQSVAHLALPPQLIFETSSDSDLRSSLAFEHIPTLLKQAVLAIEDERYLQHHGFDFRSLLRALVRNIVSMSYEQGASTITQQLVKNVMGRHRKSIYAKIKEVLLARVLETQWTKEQILEQYLNRVYLGHFFGKSIYGFQEASFSYFSKPLESATTSELAFLAGLLKGPHLYGKPDRLDTGTRRRNLVLKKLWTLGYISEEEYQQSLKEPLLTSERKKTLRTYGYLLDRIHDVIHTITDPESKNSTPLEQAQPQEPAKPSESFSAINIYTYIDPGLQEVAQNRMDLLSPETQGAILGISPEHGLIRIYLGGKDYQINQFDRLTQMKRQIGSLVKPFLLSASFKKDSEKFNPLSIYNDQKISLPIPGDKRPWSPQNFDGKYHGAVTLTTALEKSYNIPFVRLGLDLGLNTFFDFLSPWVSEPPVLSWFLGTFAMTPLEITQLYYGLFSEQPKDLKMIHKIYVQHQGSVPHLEELPLTEDQQIFSRSRALPISTEYRQQILYLLTRVAEFGTAKTLYKTFQIHQGFAGKTGTTSHGRDFWFVGGRPEELLLTVWSGIDLGLQGKFAMRSSYQEVLPAWIQMAQDALHRGYFQPQPLNFSELKLYHMKQENSANPPRSSAPCIEPNHLDRSWHESPDEILLGETFLNSAPRCH